MALKGGAFPSSLALLALLLVLFPLPLTRPPLFDPSSGPSPRLGPKNGTLTLSRNYVVRFLEYRKAEDHWAYLEETLGSLDGWRWIERRNPAASFPTDFGVLEIEDLHRMSLIKELETLGRVKDVFVDSSYSRSLFAEENPNDGTFLECKKRPGKIFTSMSFPSTSSLASLTAEPFNQVPVAMGMQTSMSRAGAQPMMMPFEMLQGGEFEMDWTRFAGMSNWQMGGGDFNPPA